MENDGCIYILINASLQKNYLKIGMSTRSAEERAKEISSSTGIPTEYLVAYEEQVPDCKKAELLIHQRLDEYRPSKNREFFVLPLNEAINVVQEIAKTVRESYTYDPQNETSSCQMDKSHKIDSANFTNSSMIKNIIIFLLRFSLATFLGSILIFSIPFTIMGFIERDEEGISLGIFFLIISLVAIRYFRRLVKSICKRNNSQA